jgi:two-component system, NarL family, nitrate/nitrite response regulator NarL
MAMRCLIIDDQQSFLAAATRLLEREGLEVVGVALNGEEAFRRAEALRPDVLLVDVFLGTESGLELARRLVGDSRVVPATVILISSHSAADLDDLIVANPAAGFITKAELSAAAIRQLVEASGRRDT